MMTQTLLFYMFSGILLTSAFFVVTARNPVHNVLFLILAFFNSAGLFILLGAEFISMLMVIVYVGAVAVLFLFVVMMMDINVSKIKKTMTSYFPLGLAVVILLFFEFSVLLDHWDQIPRLQAAALELLPKNEMTNTQHLGRVLYTKFAFLFQMAGLILLVAMIGSIVLTLRFRAGVRKQNIAEQVSRKVEDCIEVVSVPSRKGVSS